MDEELSRKIEMLITTNSSTCKVCSEIYTLIVEHKKKKDSEWWEKMRCQHCGGYH